jgi:hypothetical protein
MNSLESRYENKESNVKFYCKEFRQRNLLILFVGRSGFIKRSFLSLYQYLHTAPRQLDFARIAYALPSFHSALRVCYLFPFLIFLRLPFFM